MAKMICHCGGRYDAREADLARGWGLSCSKSCAAKRKTHGLKAAIYANGTQVPNKLKSNKHKRRRKILIGGNVTNALTIYDDDPSWDSHKNSF